MILHGSKQEPVDFFLEEGTRNFVPEFAEVMARMRKLGLVPGATVHVVERSPFDGPTYLQVTNEGEDAPHRRVIGNEIARKVHVNRP